MKQIGVFLLLLMLLSACGNKKSNVEQEVQFLAEEWDKTATNLDEMLKDLNALQETWLVVKDSLTVDKNIMAQLEQPVKDSLNSMLTKYDSYNTIFHNLRQSISDFINQWKAQSDQVGSLKTSATATNVQRLQKSLADAKEKSAAWQSEIDKAKADLHDLFYTFLRTRDQATGQLFDPQRPGSAQ